MANDYDKIFKENIAAIFLPLTEKYLGIRITRSEELKDKLQTTIEKEPDFIRLVENDRNERFILQLEFQSVDEDGMIYRMQEYYSLLRRKYQLPVKQFVMYLGRKPSAMQTTLPPEEIFSGFPLLSMHSQPSGQLLASAVPEEVILAVLGDFEGKTPAEILTRIINKLREISSEEIALRKYIRQLTILARLRNLAPETKKQLEDMALTFDKKTDVFFREGYEEGKKDMIIGMLQDDTLSIRKIAAIAKVTTQYVKEVARELKNTGPAKP